jgi:hypothetical protein
MRRQAKARGFYRDEEGRTHPITSQSVAAALTRGVVIRKVVDSKGQEIKGGQAVASPPSYPEKIGRASEDVIAIFTKQFGLAGAAVSHGKKWALISKRRTAMIFLEPSWAEPPIDQALQNLPAKPHLYFPQFPFQALTGRKKDMRLSEGRDVDIIEIDGKHYSKSDIAKALRVVDSKRVSIYTSYPFRRGGTGEAILIMNPIGQAVLLTNILNCRPLNYVRLEDYA